MQRGRAKKKNKNEKSTWLPQIEPTLNCLALCVYQFFSLFSFFFFFVHLHLHFGQRNVNETFHATGLRVQPGDGRETKETRQTGDTALELGRKEAC